MDMLNKLLLEILK